MTLNWIVTLLLGGSIGCLIVGVERHEREINDLNHRIELLEKK